MAAPKGNQFWKKRAKHGRDKLFSSADALWEACQEYFEWVEDNPLWEMKVTQYQGSPVSMEAPKMRAMTLEGLYLFLDIDGETWRSWRSDDDFSGITGKVERVIYNQKLTGAAADLLNSNIIARELGLSDKSTQEHTHSFTNMSDDELNNRIQALENELKSKA